MLHNSLISAKVYICQFYPLANLRQKLEVKTFWFEWNIFVHNQCGHNFFSEFLLERFLDENNKVAKVTQSTRCKTARAWQIDNRQCVISSSRADVCTIFKIESRMQNIQRTIIIILINSKTYVSHWCAKISSSLLAKTGSERIFLEIFF